MLSQHEIELVVAALSFSSTPDVCADWSEDLQETMVELACRLCEENNIAEIENLELLYKSEDDIDKRAETPNLTRKLMEYIPLG